MSKWAMTDHCPTCGAAVRVETSGRTSYMVPTDAERVRELEDRIRELEVALHMVLDDPDSLSGRPRTFEFVMETLSKEK